MECRWQARLLTRREIEVALLIAEGLSNAEVASMTGVSIQTMRRHAEHIMLKLGVHTRAAIGARLREPNEFRAGQPRSPFRD